MYSIMYPKTNAYFNFFCLGRCFICISIKLRLDYSRFQITASFYPDLSTNCAALIRQQRVFESQRLLQEIR